MNSTFVPQTTYPLKWSAGDNRFAKEGDRQTKSLSIFIPEVCMQQFIDYLQVLQHQKEKMRDGDTWDSETRTPVKTQGFYINAKGSESEFGLIGNINLQRITPAQETAARPPAQAGWQSNVESDDIPF